MNDERCTSKCTLVQYTKYIIHFVTIHIVSFTKGRTFNVENVHSRWFFSSIHTIVRSLSFLIFVSNAMFYVMPYIVHCFNFFKFVFFSFTFAASSSFFSCVRYARRRTNTTNNANGKGIQSGRIKRIS